MLLANHLIHERVCTYVGCKFLLHNRQNNTEEIFWISVCLFHLDLTLLYSLTYSKFHFNVYVKRQSSATTADNIRKALPWRWIVFISDSSFRSYSAAGTAKIDHQRLMIREVKPDYTTRVAPYDTYHCQNIPPEYHKDAVNCPSLSSSVSRVANNFFQAEIQFLYEISPCLLLIWSSCLSHLYFRWDSLMSKQKRKENLMIGNVSTSWL